MSAMQGSESNQERPRKRERIEMTTNDDERFEQWWKDHPYDKNNYGLEEKVFYLDGLGY